MPLIDLDTGEVLERDDQGRLVVVDLKTSARKYTDLQAEASLQLSATATPPP